MRVAAGDRAAAELAAGVELRVGAVDRDRAAHAAAGLEQPVAEAGEVEIDLQVGRSVLATPPLPTKSATVLCPEDRLSLPSMARRRERDVAVAGKRALAQRAAEVVERELAGRAVLFHISTCG